MIGGRERDDLADEAWFRRLAALAEWYGPRLRAYRATFHAAEARAVLLDLAQFCCANAPATTERLMGRRDVWLRIMHMTRLDPDEMAVLYADLTPEERHALWSPPGTPTYLEER